MATEIERLQYEVTELGYDVRRLHVFRAEIEELRSQLKTTVDALHLLIYKVEEALDGEVSEPILKAVANMMIEHDKE